MFFNNISYNFVKTYLYNDCTNSVIDLVCKYNYYYKKNNYNKCNYCDKNKVYKYGDTHFYKDMIICEYCYKEILDNL